MENPTVSQLVEMLTNTCDSTTKEHFLEEMKKIHSTLQQKFCGFVLSWIKDYAENYPVNGRNHMSIEECRDLLDAFDKFQSRPLRTNFPCL